MPSTKNETIKGRSSLGWGWKKRMMSVASEVFPSRCLWNSAVERLSRQKEPEKESRAGARALGIAGRQRGVEVIKRVAGLMESTEWGERREQRANPALRGPWRMPSVPCPFLLSAYCFQICPWHLADTLFHRAFSQVELAAAPNARVNSPQPVTGGRQRGTSLASSLQCVLHHLPGVSPGWSPSCPQQLPPHSYLLWLPSLHCLYLLVLACLLYLLVLGSPRK